ncbi:MAG: hypothetical protein GY842_06820 [bacterium]|nr:hypothetical protein [bacterium]
MRTRTLHRSISVIALWMAGVGSPASAQPCDPAWDRTVSDPGLSSTVWSLYAANQTSPVGLALYAGGQFSSAGGATAKNIAKWDGSSWSPLGTGAENGGVVYAMVVSDAGVLYVGGAFGNMGGIAGTKRIAQWDGVAWSDVGGGMVQNNAGIRALVFYQGDLYAGGYLNEIGGATARKIARWDGLAWAPLAGDPMGSSDYVETLVVYDDGGGESLYVGGYFTDAGADPGADYVFEWNGSTLTPLGRGTNNDVEAMAVWDGGLYVGGEFTRVYQTDGTEVVANKIARWDGTSWAAVGTGMDAGVSYYVWALAAFDDGNGEALYAGGSFNNPANKLARWDGSDWSAVTGGAGPNGYIYDLAVSHQGPRAGLFAGGTFTTHDGETAQRIVEWRSGLPAIPPNAQADPAEICPGQSAQLSASVPGAQIDWYTSECGGSLLGSGNALVVSPTATTTYFTQSHITSNGCESAGCAPVVVTVGEAPSISSQPLGDTVCAGQTHEFCVQATGTGTLDYQWQRDEEDIDGATDSCYLASVAGPHRCIVGGTCGTTISEDAELVVNDGPVLSDQPVNTTICAGQEHEFCVTADGIGDLHYQWQRGGSSLIGATDPCYTATVAGLYRCRVTDDCGLTFSDEATLTVDAPPPGDLDADCDVDLIDYQIFAACLTGPEGGIPPDCSAANLEANADIDLRDFAYLQHLFGG